MNSGSKSIIADKITVSKMLHMYYMKPLLERKTNVQFKNKTKHLKYDTDKINQPDFTIRYLIIILI